DLARGDDRARLSAALAGASVVIDGTGWGGGSWGFDRNACADLPVVRVTPFGDAGPYTGMAFTPFTLAALSGLSWHVADAAQPPVAQWGDQVEHLAGLHTLAAALVALWAGRGCSLEVAALEVAVALVGHHTSRYSQVPVDRPRQPPRPLWRLYR